MTVVVSLSLPGASEVKLDPKSGTYLTVFFGGVDKSWCKSE